jgi:hypothetical protein
VGSCNVHYEQFVWKPELRDMFDLMEIEREDQEAVRYQQQGLASNSYSRGCVCVCVRLLLRSPACIACVGLCVPAADVDLFLVMASE